jgi:nucleoside-diphosphate-sugar epimerase
MKITVIGASRGIGRKVVDYALERGHTVRAVARSAEGMGIDADGFEASRATRRPRAAGARGRRVPMPSF